MYSRPGYPRSIFRALRDRELGIFARKPSQVNIFYGFKSSWRDQYRFYHFNDIGYHHNPIAHSLSFSTHLRDGHALLATDEAGIITILDTKRTMLCQNDAVKGRNHTFLPPIASFCGHDGPIYDATFMGCDHLVATASGDGTVRVFDLESEVLIARLDVWRKSVECVRARTNGTWSDVVAAASKCGTFKVFDLRMPLRFGFGAGATLGSILGVTGAHETAKRNCTSERPPSGANSLVWRNEIEIITAGASDGAVKRWDLRICGKKDNYVEKVIPGLEGRGKRASGIASLDILNGKLAVNCLDSTIYVYESNALKFGHMNLLEGHEGNNFRIRAKFSPCGNFILSGSADANAYLWDLNSESANGSLAPSLMLKGHRQGNVGAVAWCGVDSNKVATGGDDCRVKIWTVKNGEEKTEYSGGEENGNLGWNTAIKLQVGLEES